MDSNVFGRVSFLFDASIDIVNVYFFIAYLLGDGSSVSGSVPLYQGASPCITVAPASCCNTKKEISCCCSVICIQHRFLLIDTRGRSSIHRNRPLFLSIHELWFHNVQSTHVFIIIRCNLFGILCLMHFTLKQIHTSHKSFLISLFLYLYGN